MGGFAHANYSGDTNGFGAKTLGLYPDSNTFAISASVIGENNVSPNLALRLGAEYFFTGFGSSIQNSRRIHRRHRLPLRQAVNALAALVTRVVTLSEKELGGPCFVSSAQCGMQPCCRLRTTRSSALSRPTPATTAL